MPRKIADETVEVARAANRSCASCVFYDAKQQVPGYCRKNPPQIADRSVTAWPTVRPHDWCGAWEHA